MGDRESTTRRGPAVTAVTLIALLAAVLVTACGGSGSSHTATSSLSVSGGSGTAPASIEIQSCTSGSKGSTSSSTTGTSTTAQGKLCTITFTDGSRFRCDAEVARSATLTTVAAEKGCTKLSPLKIPASWKPALAELASARTCLARAGITALGGPAFGDLRSNAHAAVGELITEQSSAAAIIGFFASDADANRLGQSKLPTAAKGNVRVVSLNPKQPAKWSTVTGCALAGA
jgi:hypothetical protein